jgi:hypothetical protein
MSPSSDRFLDRIDIAPAIGSARSVASQLRQELQEILAEREQLESLRDNTAAEQQNTRADLELLIRANDVRYQRALDGLNEELADNADDQRTLLGILSTDPRRPVLRGETVRPPLALDTDNGPDFVADPPRRIENNRLVASAPQVVVPPPVRTSDPSTTETRVESNVTVHRDPTPTPAAPIDVTPDPDERRSVRESVSNIAPFVWVAAIVGGLIGLIFGLNTSDFATAYITIEPLRVLAAIVWIILMILVFGAAAGWIVNGLLSRRRA